jgi:hypothetical protein
MNRSVIVSALALVVVSAACVVRESPPANPPPQPAPPPVATAPAPTATVAPTAAPTYAPAPTAAPPIATAPMPPTGMPGLPGLPGLPGGAPGSTPGAPSGGFTLPGVCIPIGTWTKRFDNGLPASGTVTVGTPLIFNQFFVTDGVVVVGMPAGSLKGTGAMTSTNDLSVDVTNAGYVLSYTCKFSGANCNEGSCTVTKGGLGGFKLVKQ